VFGCEGPQVRCRRYNARLTYLNTYKKTRMVKLSS
jgi:hypothetical protein